LPNDDYLNVSVWPGKTDPTADQLTIRVRHLSGEQWETVGRIALYRTKEGEYRQLPDRPLPVDADRPVPGPGVETTEITPKEAPSEEVDDV
jgi:hypothetical protein